MGSQGSGRIAVTAAGLFACAPAFAADPLPVEVDGVVDRAEWADAREITDFRQVQPLTGAPGTQSTRAWMKATPAGLAVAFENLQDARAPRTRQWVRRDFDEQVDRVNVMVDFDGDGRTGYAFTIASTGGVTDAVVSNQRDFSDDWDGQWRHAVAEMDGGWSVEVLIPWHIATMRDGTGDMRTIRVYLDRVLGATGERSAWPAASFERPRFLSDFTAVEVPAYSQSLLAVTPYASSLYDNVRHRLDHNVGADLFWKPNGRFQLSATVNPDFGQVESDDLVVNFSATEEFVSDKRPFFTENQGIFDFTTPSDDSQLLYTRRIGAPADDGSGAADITAAVKLNGSIGATKYGIFSAEEADATGRSFHALRVVRDFGSQNLGAMATRVERPFLDRTATVAGIDHDWRPTPRVTAQSRIIASRIEDGGVQSDGFGATTWFDHELDDGWRQQWLGMYFDDGLEINDAGYLARNDLLYGHYQVSRRFTDMPEASRYASKDWRGRVSTARNDGGLKLEDQLRISRESRLRNGSYEYAQVNFNSAGHDDRLTRGNGALRVPANFDSYFEYERPRKGRWAHSVEAEVFSGGLAGNDRIGVALGYEPVFFASDTFSLTGEVFAMQRGDWLVWERDTLFGSHRGREAAVGFGVDWAMDARQELRVKLQAVAVEGRLRQAYRVGGDGHAVAVDDAVDDISVANLGFQVRYRYELAPLSYLYIVYGRGGYSGERVRGDAGDLLADAFDLRDDEQLLVKLSYRFDR